MKVVKYWNRCPERLWDLHPWRCSRLNWTQPRATSSEWTSEKGVGLDDLQRSLPN